MTTGPSLCLRLLSNWRMREQCKAQPMLYPMEKDKAGAGEGQQAMLGNNAPSAQQPAHSWLLSVLAQQRRLQPQGSLPHAAFPKSQGGGFPVSSAASGGIVLPSYQPSAAFVLPQLPQMLHSVPGDELPDSCCLLDRALQTHLANI